MRFLLLLASVVLAVLAAILGWSYTPHHAFSLLAIAIACLGTAVVLTEPAVASRL